MRFTLITSVAVGVVVLAGCDDPNAFRIDPILVRDTVEVAAPLPNTARLPSALDVTGNGTGQITGGRFPERPRDALQWDFVVRVDDGEVVLLPARGLGVLDSRAALTGPIPGETFASLREAPGQSVFSMTDPVVMRVGNVHVARSRDVSTFICTGVQFAKLQPLEVDVATGRLVLEIVTNERCNDPRLVPDV